MIFIIHGNTGHNLCASCGQDNTVQICLPGNIESKICFDLFILFCHLILIQSGNEVRQKKNFDWILLRFFVYNRDINPPKNHLPYFGDT